MPFAANVTGENSIATAAENSIENPGNIWKAGPKVPTTMCLSNNIKCVQSASSNINDTDGSVLII